MTIKALSIRQPWAFAILMGCKPVENRSWPTHIRGPVLIHAGKTEDTSAIKHVLGRMAYQSNTAQHELWRLYRHHVHLGGIVGAVSITDCVTEHESQWFTGPWGYVLDLPTFCDFVPMKGQLGFFTVPDDVAARVFAPPHHCGTDHRPALETTA